MDIIRVHPKNFRFLFYLYHGSAAAGFITVVSFLLQIIPYDFYFIIGVLMIAIPFLLAPPELVILLKDHKLIFRHRTSCSTLSFKDILLVEASAYSVKIKDYKNSTLLEIHQKHFKNINLSELSEYLRDLLVGNKKVDPMRYTSVKFTEFKFVDRCKSILTRQSKNK